MVYYTDWPTFASAAKQLYAERPNDTRYCIKYRHKAGSLVLKVTDDRQVQLTIPNQSRHGC